MEMYPFYNIDPRILKAGEETMAEAAEAMALLEALANAPVEEVVHHG